MARDYSMVSPRIWQSDRFQALPDAAHRLAMMYLLTGPQVTSAGCYRVSMRYLAFDLGVDPAMANDMLCRIADTLLIRYDGAGPAVYISDWFTYSPPTSGKHALGTLKQLRDVKSPLKLLAIRDLVAVCERRGFKLSKAFHDLAATLGADQNTPPMPNENGMDRVLIGNRYTDTETETPLGTEPPASAVPNGSSEPVESQTREAVLAADPGDIPAFLRRTGVPAPDTGPGVGDLATALNRLGSAVKSRPPDPGGDK